MKKIIAAALSVLLGTVGLTVVDKTIESRVATLESEVVELREEVSNYHTTIVYETIPTDQEPSTEDLSIDFSETSCPEETEEPSEEPSSGFFVGDYLYEDYDSQHKFLLRKYSNGSIIYISPKSYNGPINSQTTYSAPINGDVAIDDPQYTYTDHFLYITETSAQWTETEEEISYSYSYDKDYSQVSTPHITEQNYVTIRYKGYTDPELAGKRINFVLDSSTPEQISITNNVIDENGGFDFEVVYCYPSTPYHYCINSIRIY